MPILEKKEITVKAYMKERLQYTGWSPDTFLRMCRNSLENKENFTIIDGTTEFTIPFYNLEEFFTPEPVEPEPSIEEEGESEALDIAPIEAKPVTKPKPKPRTRTVGATKK